MANSTDTPDWSKLPAPIDDGLTDHLKGMRVPSVSLAATDGQQVDLGASSGGLIIVYAYPRTGVPGEPNPEGWDTIPGARGCTPQSCAFRDHFTDLKNAGVSAVYGLSTQSSEYQREVVERLHLPFALLCDQELNLTNAMRLPTFNVGPLVLLKRVTLILEGGHVEAVFYPVFPPDRDAENVLRWLSDRKNAAVRSGTQ